MFVLFIDAGYGLRENSVCSPSHASCFSTLSEAKRKCSDDNDCPMLYDSRGKGNIFCLCKKDATIKYSTRGTILHIKRREYNIFVRSIALLV